MNPDTRAALTEIAERHNFTLESLLGKGMRRKAKAARREAYQYLRAKKWTSAMIGREFGRHPTTILQALEDEDRAAERLARYRAYMAERRAA